MGIRQRIFEIIDVSEGNDVLSSIYDFFMLAVIVLSLVPMAFKLRLPLFRVLERTAVTIFIIDYALRWITADYKFKKSGKEAGNLYQKVLFFVKYPFTFMAIVDLVSILPSLTALNRSLRAFRVLRMLRAFRVFRVFKILRYSKSIRTIAVVLQKSKEPLLAVCVLAIGYIVVSALVIFNIEPESFDTFFDAIYWATVSLTTMGYGDIYPVTTLGRLITMLSSFFGVAIVALPAGIITAGYMQEIRKIEDDENKAQKN